MARRTLHQQSAISYFNGVRSGLAALFEDLGPETLGLPEGFGLELTVQEQLAALAEAKLDNAAQELSQAYEMLVSQQVA